MRRIIAAALVSALCACSGGGGDDETIVVAAAPTPTPTPIEVTQCGDINVSLEAAEEIVEAANEEGVDVEDLLDEPQLNEGGLGQVTPTSPVGKGVVIAACGSTVVTDDSVSDDDSINIVTNPAAAERLVELIHAGEIHSIEVLR